MNITQGRRVSDRWQEEARISSLLQREQMRSGHAGFDVQADVNESNLPTMAACRLLQPAGHSWHQCIDNIREDYWFTHVTPSVLASVVSGTNRRNNVIKTQTNSSISLAVLNSRSTRYQSQLPSESSVQAQQNHCDV